MRVCMDETTHTHTHTHTLTHTHRGPAAQIGFIVIGDVIIWVALDEEPIPTETDADIAAFINARICGPGLGFRV